MKKNASELSIIEAFLKCCYSDKSQHYRYNKPLRLLKLVLRILPSRKRREALGRSSRFSPLAFLNTIFVSK